MTTEYRYAGPDGEEIGSVPPGAGAAIGSEYCVHLLPGAADMDRLRAAAAAREIPLMLLTPYFRDAELKRAIPLFRAISVGADAAVAVNDWGVLLALRVLFPGLRLTVGRLLSGQKRCPRIEVSPRLSAEEKAWHRQGLFSSAPARKYLAEKFGVSGFHVDAFDGADAPVAGDAPAAGAPPSLFVHAPYAIVTVSDACPWLGGRSSSSLARCPRPCRKGAVLLREPSGGREMIQRGKARFVRAGSPPPREGRRDAPFGSVFYEKIP